MGVRRTLVRPAAAITGALAALLTAVLVTAGCGAGSPAPSAGASVGASAGASAGAESPGPGNHVLAMTWETLPRAYEIHVPPAFRPGARLPLVVVMHYAGGTAADMRELTGFDAKADREGFLVVYPVGLGGRMNALTCCGSSDDVGFIKAVVAHLVADWGADPRRVYATGISNGADMSFRLAVEAPGVFAAIAPVSGGFVGSKAETVETFRPTTPVSVISFVGNSDPASTRVIYGLDIWQRRLGCDIAPVQYLDEARSGYRFTAACADGSEVISYTIIRMAHQWPGGTSVDGMGRADASVNAVDTMWEFFTRHPGVA